MEIQLLGNNQFSDEIQYHMSGIDNACKIAPVQITTRAIIVCMKRVKVKAMILVYVFLRSRKLVINKNSMLVFDQYNMLLYYY